MSASAAKRRKTSPTTSVAVDASNTQSNPSTPKRASFQSPTKASLARSHPNLLPQSAGRSQVQTRGQGLRQELLSRRTSQSVPRPQSATPQTPRRQDESDGNKLAHPVEGGAESFSGAIRNLFNAEPSRLPTSSRTPLRARQPPIRLVNNQSREDDPQMSKQAQPKAQRGRRPSKKDAENDEPDLPPTPIQLGLDAQPDRPRGLASSSPRTSGSSRQRTRLNESRHTSSPSKLRGQAREMRDSAPDIPSTRAALLATDVPAEAPESDIDAPAEEEMPSIPAEVLQKRSLRDSLSAQLARLRSDLASLSHAVAEYDTDTSNSGDIDPSLLALLTTQNLSCAKKASDDNDIHYPSRSITKPTALGPRPLPYLTLFAPGNLQLHSTTSTSAVDGKPQQIHVLELWAPEPWPAHVFATTIRVTIDVEEKQVKNVEMVKMRPGTAHQWLLDWVKRRLAGESSLHRYDVGGLVWGIGRWWEGCVKRAKAWRSLEEKFIESKTAKMTNNSQEGVEVLGEDVMPLLSHLARTSMEFEVGAMKRVMRSSKGTEPPKQNITKVMLLWDLLLDWTGEVDEIVGVAAAGMRGTGEQGVKEVFGKIYKRDGVLKAMEGVLVVLAKGMVD